MRGERYQHRQEGDQRHDGVDKTDAHILQRWSKTHGVFLHTLCGPFDMTQLLPVRHVIFVHRRTPAEHVVTDKEVVQHTDHHSDQRNPQKDAHFAVKLFDSDFMRRT